MWNFPDRLYTIKYQSAKVHQRKDQKSRQFAKEMAVCKQFITPRKKGQYATWHYNRICSYCHHQVRMTHNMVGYTTSQFGYRKSITSVFVYLLWVSCAFIVFILLASGLLPEHLLRTRSRPSSLFKEKAVSAASSSFLKGKQALLRIVVIISKYTPIRFCHGPHLRFNYAEPIEFFYLCFTLLCFCFVVLFSFFF